MSASDPREIAKFDAIAHQFWDPQGGFGPLHHLNPARAEFIGRQANLRAARVLDVGCGGGLLAEALARAGAQVTAIDLAEGMIEIARLHAIESGLQIDYRQCAGSAMLPDAAGQFDVVTCMEMLEHVPDPEAVVQELAALARPGGAVVISTINRNLRSFLLAIVGAEYIARLLPRGTHEYERLIRPAELARWGRAAGLQLTAIAGLEYNPALRQARLTRGSEVNYIAAFTRGDAR